MKALAPAAVLAAILLAPAAQAGGPFERIVAVGAGGGSSTIELSPSGPRSEAALSGVAVNAPAGGYVRLYSFIGPLPAEPGRFYPASHVTCITWKSAPLGCVRLGNAGLRLLEPAGRLPLRHDGLTAPISVSFAGHVLPYANGNIFAAFELAFELPPAAAVQPVRSDDAVPLSVVWRGPAAHSRPQALLLTPTGIVANGVLRPLGRGIWCYLSVNIPDRLKSARLDAEIASERC